MDDRARIAFCAVLGALVGGAAGYVMLTEGGQAFRRDLEPRLDQLMGEAQRLGVAVERTRRAVSEGVASFNQLVNEPLGQQKSSTH